MWLKDYVYENMNEETIILTGKQVFTQFEGWRIEHNINYNTTPQKLGIKISNLRLTGIEKGEHTRNGETKIYNIKELKKYFGIGISSQIEEEGRK